MKLRLWLVAIGIAVVAAALLWKLRYGQKPVVQSPPPVKMPVSAAPTAPAPLEVEQRVSVRLPEFGSFDTDCVGSLTVLSKDTSGGMLLGAERPGDGWRFSAALSLGPSGGLSGGAPQMTFCGGSGSEVRFVGRQAYDDTIITSDNGDRLCFRKVKQSWVYVCGRGAVETRSTKKTIALGRQRSVESCLMQLDSSDALLREGCARDLGRLARSNDHSRVVTRLGLLLTDTTAAVRRGAAEGLGRLGGQTAFDALKAARAGEKDKTAKEFMGEALAVCSGTALLGLAGAPVIPVGEASKLYVDGVTNWTGVILRERLGDGDGKAESVPLARLESKDATERQAAVRLLGVTGSEAARKALREAARSDPDKRVKSAAQEALMEAERR